MILCQASLNVFAVLGLAPLTGVPLPFVSYGASNLVILLAAMGLLVNIASGGGRQLRAVGRPAAPARTARGSRRDAHPTYVLARRHDWLVNQAQTRIVIAAGGTAGHVVPALAVAGALRAEGAEVCFVGGARAEAELVPEAGYELHQLNVRGIDRRNPVRAAGAIARAAGAVVRSRALLGPGGRCGAGRRRLRRGRRGSRGGQPAVAAGAHGGRQPSGPVEPGAGPLRGPRVPRVPDRGPPGCPLPRDRSSRPSTCHRSGRRPRAPGNRAGRAFRAGIRRVAGRTLDQRGGDRGTGRRRLPRAARDRDAGPSGSPESCARRPLRAARLPGQRVLLHGTGRL